jgi:hypothetical protein
MSIIAITVIVAMGIPTSSAGNEGMMKTAKSGMMAARRICYHASAWLIVNVVMNVLADKGSPDKPFLDLCRMGNLFYCDTVQMGIGRNLFLGTCSIITKEKKINLK